MDQTAIATGIVHFNNQRGSASLAEWNAQYEAFSVKNDWWFKAAVAVTGWVRASVKASASATAPAPQLAHA